MRVDDGTQESALAPVQIVGTGTSAPDVAPVDTLSLDALRARSNITTAIT